MNSHRQSRWLNTELLSDVLEELERVKTDEAAGPAAMNRGEGVVAEIQKLLDSDRVRYVD